MFYSHLVLYFEFDFETLANLNNFILSIEHGSDREDWEGIETDQGDEDTEGVQGEIQTILTNISIILSCAVSASLHRVTNLAVHPATSRAGAGAPHDSGGRHRHHHLQVSHHHSHHHITSS